MTILSPAVIVMPSIVVIVVPLIVNVAPTPDAPLSYATDADPGATVIDDNVPVDPTIAGA